MSIADPSIQSLSFESALKELEAIVKKLEGGKDSLEDAITDYERGNALREHCERKLQEAKLKVDKMLQRPDGTIDTLAFETENVSG